MALLLGACAAPAPVDTAGPSVPAAAAPGPTRPPVAPGPTFGPPTAPGERSSASAPPRTTGEATVAGPAPSRPVLVEPAPTAATPAPAWLGTRPLGPAGSGPVAPQDTPPELQDRRIVSVDVLPPPRDEEFRHTVGPVPPDVLARSTWQPACPVTADELRHVTVSFWGFDGRPHTGELLVHSDATDAVVAAFEAMHTDRFPLEEVRIVRAEELAAAPTGDGNVTSAFVCRPSVGSQEWSEHAYGRAVDVNPFHNPYVRGRGEDQVVIPELATAYTDRGRGLPGMLDAESAAVRAFRGSGWVWGGGYRTLKDWQHFSATGG